MQVDEATHKRMPPHLQALFDKMPNPGHDEVEAEFAKHGKKGGGAGGRRPTKGIGGEGKVLGGKERSGAMVMTYGDKGTASRFFYCAKTSKKERNDSRHPTVKPVALMRWLVRMVTPPNRVVFVCESCDNTPYDKSQVQAVRRAIPQPQQDGDVLLQEVPVGEHHDPTDGVPGVLEAGAEGQGDSLLEGLSHGVTKEAKDVVPDPMRTVRDHISATGGRGSQVLQPGVCGEGERPGETEGQVENVSRLPDALPSGTSDGDQERLPDGAQAGGGGRAGQDASTGRSRSSRQRRQGRQQVGKSDGDVQAGSRQDQEAASKDGDRVSTLSGDHEVEQRCPKCGGSLKRVIRTSIVLDPFAGTGSTGEAALLEGHRVILVEREAEYIQDIRNRLQNVDAPAPIRKRTRR